MKIIIFAPYFYPHTGGLEQFIWETATRLAKFGYSIIVVSSRIGDETLAEKINRIQIIRLDTWNILGGTFPIVKFNKTNSEIWKMLSDKKFDLAITNTRFFLLSLMGQFFARKNRICSIHIEHGTCYPQLKNPLIKFCAYLYDQTLGRLTLKMADKNLAISKAAALFARKLGAKSVDMIYNSIDTDFFKPEIKIKREKIITFIGRLIEGKGVQDLIEAFNKIEDKNYTLNIIGDGNYKNILEKIARVNPRIIFWGAKDASAIKTILNKTSIFINPSYSEGLPTSVLEAGAMGVATIATNVGGTKEIIDNNKNGFLIPPQRPDTIAKKLQMLIDNPGKRQLFGRRLRKKIISRFNWESSITQLINIFKNVKDNNK